MKLDLCNDVVIVREDDLYLRMHCNISCSLSDDDDEYDNEGCITKSENGDDRVDESSDSVTKTDERGVGIDLEDPYDASDSEVGGKIVDDNKMIFMLGQKN